MILFSLPKIVVRADVIEFLEEQPIFEVRRHGQHERVARRMVGGAESPDRLAMAHRQFDGDEVPGGCGARRAPAFLAMSERSATRQEKGFDGHIAVVTGGASGIGLAITRRPIEEGASVVVADINGESLAKACAELGDLIETANGNVRVEAQVERMVKTAIGRFGGLDVGFDAAGLAAPGQITELSEADWDLTSMLCLKGQWRFEDHVVQFFSPICKSLVR